MFFILNLLLIVDLAHAVLHGEGEPLRARYTCDEQQVSHCQQENHNLFNQCYARGRDYEKSEAVATGELAPVLAQREIIEASRKATAEKSEIIRKETQFIDDLEKKSPVPPQLFSGSPSLESVFFLDQTASLWDERYPLERGEKLRAQALSLTISHQKIENERSENENKIRALSSARDEFTRQKLHWMNNAGIHAIMSAKGCRERICTGR